MGVHGHLSPSSSLFLLVLLLVLPVSVLADAVDLWNIDCGASAGHKDRRNLSWVGDGGYVRAGESREVANVSSTTTFQTVRSFPTGRKNCFTVPVGANRKIRVTLEFYYGNYDGLSKPPSFNLLFDTFNYGPLQTRNVEPGFYEYMTVVYVAKGSNTSICLGREYDDQVPFINALQVSALAVGMYPLANSTFILKERRRVAFGSNQTIRYPDDPYDRVWSTATASVEGFNYTTVVSNVSKALNTSSHADDPPRKLFEAAAAPPRGEKNLTIRAAYLSGQSLYLTMYFHEPFSGLSGSSRLHRSFNIYMRDALLTTKPVVPPSDDVLELSGLLDAAANTAFILVPTDNSSLPPVISGLEALTVAGFMTSSGTYAMDVDALAILQDNFQALGNWSGDPCLPKNFNWEWVECNSDEPPRITALSLDGYGLSGTLPNFSVLEALETIDLHNNSLTGPIPGFLGNLPNLRKLNLADNNFSSIPPSLVNNQRIRSFNITGNPLLEPKEAPTPSSPTTPSDGNGCNRIRGSALVSFLLALVAALIL